MIILVRVLLLVVASVLLAATFLFPPDSAQSNDQRTPPPSQAGEPDRASLPKLPKEPYEGIAGDLTPSSAAVTATECTRLGGAVVIDLKGVCSSSQTICRRTGPSGADQEVCIKGWK